MKKVQVNTPLILEQNGQTVRIETGAIIHLTDDVYADVAAHVMLLSDESGGEFGNQAQKTQSDEPNTASDEGETAKKSTRKKVDD